jgi:hypothetical protein
MQMYARIANRRIVVDDWCGSMTTGTIISMGTSTRRTFGHILTIPSLQKVRMGICVATFSTNQGTFSILQGTFSMIQGTFSIIQGNIQHHSGNIQHRVARLVVLLMIYEAIAIESYERLTMNS